MDLEPVHELPVDRRNGHPWHRWYLLNYSSFPMEEKKKWEKWEVKQNPVPECVNLPGLIIELFWIQAWGLDSQRLLIYHTHLQCI